MNDLNMKLDELYKELGKAYYEGNFEKPLPQLVSILDNITQAKKDIEEYNKHLCPNCHNKITDEMVFCASCGYKLK